MGEVKRGVGIARTTKTAEKRTESLQLTVSLGCIHNAWEHDEMQGKQ